MTATVQIVQKNGTGGTATDVTSGTVRFKNADNATIDVANPMVIPGSGTDWSYEKWLRLRATVAPAVQITNAKFYMDGANGFGTGVNLYAKAITAYATPVEGTGTAGYADAFGYTSGAPLTVGAGTYSGTGEFADHVVLEMAIGTAAVQGQLTAETATFSYDEI